MRKCLKCGIEKELTEFRKREKWFTHKCKECLNAPFRTGKEHTGRFKKGHRFSERTQFKKGQIPHNKVKKLSSEEIEKMKEAYKKRKPRPERGGKGRHTLKYSEWRKAVFQRDNYECKHCQSKENLHPHHVIAWKDNEKLRFDVANGLTLCNSCHMSLEFKERQKKGISTEFKKGCVAINKGKPHSETHKENLKKAWLIRKARGDVAWNKGQKWSQETIEKIRKNGKEQYKNRKIAANGRFI